MSQRKEGQILGPTSWEGPESQISPPQYSLPWYYTVVNASINDRSINYIWLKKTFFFLSQVSQFVSSIYNGQSRRRQSFGLGLGACCYRILREFPPPLLKVEAIFSFPYHVAEYIAQLWRSKNVQRNTAKRWRKYQNGVTVSGIIR